MTEETAQPGTDRPLRVAVTGTPGTGKTTATDALAERANAGENDAIDASEYDAIDASEYDDIDAAETDWGTLDVVHLNDVVQDAELYDDVDEDRDSVVVDLDALADWIDDHLENTDADVVVLDSHLSHHLDADRVVVLRCHPETLAERLTDRGEHDAKAAENAESEALDVILSESVDAHGTERVYEIETTDRDPIAVADAIATVIAGEREPSAGTVDYIEYL